MVVVGGEWGEERPVAGGGPMSVNLPQGPE